MKILGMLVLCFYVSLSERNKDTYISHNKYDSIAQSVKSFEDSREQDIGTLKIGSIGNVKKKIKNNVERNVTKYKKIETAIQRFMDDHFPSFYHSYNFAKGLKINANDRLDSIKRTVNETVTTGNLTELATYYSKYNDLLVMYGPNERNHIQIADCVAMMTELDQIIDSEPTYDGALNAFTEILIMPELSDTHFTLVAKRYIAFLGVRGDVDGIIDVQQRLVERFPQGVAELRKLEEMRYAAKLKLDAHDEYQRILQLDSSDPIFCNPLICYML